MLKFMHGYVAETWDAQVNSGLVRDCDGVRFCQTTRLGSEKKFNELAAKDSTLYNIIKERNCPFYVDRLQGGTYISDYRYDQKLIEEYKRMLGDKFWGFQMHEWLSNYSSDLRKLEDLPEESWTVEGITAHIKKAFPYPYLFLESMTAEEMAHYGKPKSFWDYYSFMTDIFKKRQKVGDLIPVDSASLMYAFELEEGCTRIMPEVGAQTGDARVQICYARGMTGKEGLHYGVYYEPWGRTPNSIHEKIEGRPPITACCYQADGKNEWEIGGSADFPFQTVGHNGGGSRSLQKRIFLYSYLSNADFMSEEWGVCNLFFDWKSFELSPYGKVKKDFVDFMEKYPDVGEKLTPIAAVLPNDLPYIENVFKKPHYKPVFEIDHADYGRVKEGVIKLFANSAPMAGTETTTLSNNEIPDALDLLNEGFGDLTKYDYLVDLTFKDTLARTHKNICSADEVKDILRKILPCFVEGELHWLVNRRKGGGYYLSVFNHSGIVRTLKEGEFFLEEEKKTVSVSFKNGAAPTLLEGEGVLSKDGEAYRLTVPAGGWAFIKF